MNFCRVFNSVLSLAFTRQAVAIATGQSQKFTTSHVRGNHTTGTNWYEWYDYHLYSVCISVCITNSNGEPNVINTARYRQSSWYYIGSPMIVSPYMESGIITYDKVKGKEKELSCDNQ